MNAQLFDDFTATLVVPDGVVVLKLPPRVTPTSQRIGVAGAGRLPARARA